MNARPTFVRRARQRGFSPAQAKAWWRAAIANVRRVEASAAAGEIDSELVTAVRRDGAYAARPPFPVEGASAAHAAEAFITLARGLGVALDPVRIRAMTPALGACATLIETLLADLQVDEARTWQGRLAPEMR